MFRKEFGDRRKDRRRVYSFRRHFARLKQEGRLPQVASATVALLIVAGVTFGQCRGDSITGPSATTSASGSVAPATSLVPASDLPPPFTENVKERPAFFLGTNPCNGEPVIAKGKRHDKLSASFSATSFQADHHINDSFKGVPLDAQGAEITDPAFEYVGSDVHNHKTTINFLEGQTTDRDLTNEHLSRRGGGDHWVLHVVQITKFSAEDPDNPTVEMKGHASCPDKTHCTLSNDCPDQAFTFIPTPDATP
jgi:hypothetical protein